METYKYSVEEKVLFYENDLHKNDNKYFEKEKELLEIIRNNESEVK